MTTPRRKQNSGHSLPQKRDGLRAAHTRSAPHGRGGWVRVSDPNLLLADWGDRRGDIKAGLAPWAPRWTLRRVRWAATGGLAAAALGALGWAVVARAPVLVGIDAVGLLLMGGTVWGMDPTRPRDAFLADLVVAWPVVPGLAAWMIV